MKAVGLSCWGIVALHRVAQNATKVMPRPDVGTECGLSSWDENKKLKELRSKWSGALSDMFLCMSLVWLCFQWQIYTLFPYFQNFNHLFALLSRFGAVRRRRKRPKLIRIYKAGEKRATVHNSF